MGLFQNKTLEVLNTNTSRRQKQHRMDVDGCLGTSSLSHCRLDNKRSPRKVAKKDLMAINSSETSAVIMVMNDLIGELEKAELIIGDLVCSSFLHDVIVDKDVSLHEWMDGRKAL